MPEIGIYRIINKINKSIYIGSSISLKKRKYKHFYRLKTNKHDNQHLQNAWNKYGSENFEFEILMYCDQEKLLKFEQKCFDIFKPEYNICKKAGHTLGYKHSLQMRKKISDIVKTKMTKEIIEKIRLSKKGKKYNLTEEQKKIRSKRMSDSNNPMFGKHINLKSVERIDPNTGEIKEYHSIVNASLDGFNESHISSVCKGYRKIHKGYWWKYL